MQSGKYQILLLTILLFGCSDNKKRGEFYGHVKTIKEFIANSPANLANEDSAFSVCKLYNIKGELIQASRIDGRINFIYTYKYDDKGRQIEKREIQQDVESTIITTYKYDSKGNRIEEDNFLRDADHKDEPTLEIIYKYNNRGNKIEERDSSQTGLDEVIAYTYDDKGNNIGALFTTYNRGADAEEDDDIIDSANIRTANTPEQDSASVTETNTTIDTLKNVNVENGDDDTIVRVFSDKVIYKYDDKGNVIEEKESDSDGKNERVFTYKYECDSKNNWTKKSEYLNSRLIQVTKREFEYY